LIHIGFQYSTCYDLEANQEEMENLEVLNQTLLVKEHESNDDFEQAHTNSNVNVFNIEKDGHSNGQRSTW
jgi:hypothetical protein